MLLAQFRERTAQIEPCPSIAWIELQSQPVLGHRFVESTFIREDQA
jgi:hypothetical protein